MARLSFKDRFLTPAVARAMMSPSGILLAGAGAAAVVATGLPLVAAPLAALGAWGARVLAAVPKGPPEPERIDPFSVPEPWRGAVVEALKAQVRFDKAVEATEAGPIRDRLRSIGARIDDGVREVERIARRGAQLTSARAAIDAEEATAELARLERDAAEPGAAGSKLDRAVQALRAQVDTARRLEALVDDARAQLVVLDARLDESVARAIELSVRVDDAEELGAVGADVDGLVDEMEALRLALEETAGHEPRAAGA